jgi:LuxR family maltose regulon positive regulatory protein
VPLDDRRGWYRYHQLFADVLQARLRDERPGDVADLHRRASAWYDRNGEPAEAIRHALAGTDFQRAADLAELAIPAMLRSRRETTLRDWLTALPDEVIRVRPVLSAGLAAALLAVGELDDVDNRLRDAEKWLDQASGHSTGPQVPPGTMVVVDDEEFRRLPAATEAHRAGLALALGDEVGTVTHARRALEIAGEDDHLSRAGASALLGLTFWAGGDLEAAYQAYTECLAGLLRAGNVADTLGCAIVLADVRLVQGRLGEAGRIYEQGLQRALQPDRSVLRGTADMYVGLSALSREQNDLAAARDFLLRSQELGVDAALPQNPYRWRVAMARIQEAEGNLPAADVLLGEAERLYVGDFSPNVRPIAASRARLWVTQGRIAEALDWTRLQGLSADDELSYLREFEHLTLARVLLARQQTEQALALLERLLGAAEAGGRVGSIIEILVLQALAEDRGGAADALVPLARALNLAEPEGYVRLFVDEGPPMATLLGAAREHRITRGYVRRLMAAFGEPENGDAGKELVDQLSRRELEVLRLLATELSGPEIAREFVVSVNTVRTHTKNIYAKLGVNNRRAAIRRASQLGLLPGT